MYNGEFDTEPLQVAFGAIFLLVLCHPKFFGYYALSPQHRVIISSANSLKFSRATAMGGNSVISFRPPASN